MIAFECFLIKSRLYLEAFLEQRWLKLVIGKEFWGKNSDGKVFDCLETLKRHCGGLLVTGAAESEVLAAKFLERMKGDRKMAQQSERYGPANAVGW